MKPGVPRDKALDAWEYLQKTAVEDEDFDCEYCHLNCAQPLVSVSLECRTEAVPQSLADNGNNTASGGSADTMETVAEALRQGLTGIIAGPICDPASVAAMLSPPPSAEKTPAAKSNESPGKKGKKTKPVSTKTMRNKGV